MANFATVAYTITPTGPTAVTLNAVMASVPLPLDVLQAMGVYAVSDATVGTTRTVKFALGPSLAAIATCTLTPENTVTEVTLGLGDNGLNYIQPPIVSFTGGGPGGADLEAFLLSGHKYPKARAYLNMQNAHVSSGGALYNPATTFVGAVGGLPPALFRQDQTGPSWGSRNIEPKDYPAPNGPPYAVNAVSLVVRGRGYSPQTYVQFIDGQLQPGGHQAQAYISGFGPNGEILGVVVFDPGEGYSIPPKVNLIDPTNGTQIASAGTQAKIVALMGAGTPPTLTPTIVGGVILAVAPVTAGNGLVSQPQIVIYDSSGAGSGASVIAQMGVGRIDVDYPGLGMTTAPNVVLTPWFKAQYPDVSDQRKPFNFFPLFWALQKATASQVVPATPVLT